LSSVPGYRQCYQSPPPEGRPEGATEGTPEGATEGTPVGATEVTSEGTPEGATEVTSEGTPEGATEVTPEGATEGTPEGATEGTPEGADDGIVILQAIRQEFGHDVNSSEISYTVRRVLSKQSFSIKSQQYSLSGLR